MSRPSAVKLGPFTGGLNTVSDPTSIADNELVECYNFELDLDGSLTCRPAITEFADGPSGLPGNKPVQFIGKANIAGDHFLIGCVEGDGIYSYDGDATWDLIVAGVESHVAIQYQDLVFIVATPSSGSNGGYWDGAVWTADANMPRGDAALFHKQRMFVVPGITQTGPAAHQLKFTDPISIAAPTPLVWTPTNLIPVGQGDGENLIDVVVHQDNLLLFKQDSTYAFAFDADPAGGILRKINNNIGASTLWCVNTFENSVFTFHEGNLYEVVNYDFAQVNRKVLFELDGSLPDFADERVLNIYTALLGDRILIRYFNRMYVYGLRTKTWSEWGSQQERLNNIGRPLEFPDTSESLVEFKYFAGANYTQDILAPVIWANVVYLMYDKIENSIGERAVNDAGSDYEYYDIECTMRTKNFDANDSHHYKRLMWWGADVLTNRAIVGVATPIVASFAVTWNQLHAYTWNQLLTWNSPLNAIPSVTTEVAGGQGAGRVFVKFLKSLRWRQINYKVTLLSDGTEAARLFSLTVIVGNKETVVRQVS